ncbi:MAG: VOC family protein [Microcella sp.]|uniref:VOC family protein n=1 Tax=Microcella sp. TaxID=1913979 RepID=UPI0024C782BC|nr:VOC family protein [Microcella sp.]UYN83140.1 MAG: VOC family protein [Microcella sp.]
MTIAPLTTTTSVFVDDQHRARDFYTRLLGYVIRADIPLGEHHWLTVGLPDGAPSQDLSLEPNEHPQAQALQKALREEGIPFFSIGVADVTSAVEQLRADGVEIVQDVTDLGPVSVAIIDDTVGNLVQLAQLTN